MVHTPGTNQTFNWLQKADSDCNTTRWTPLHFLPFQFKGTYLGESMKRNYCVYMHITPSRKRYIGITCQEPKKRWDNGWGYDRCPYFMNAIRKYGWNNIDHIILCVGLSREQASFLEKEFIARFKTTDSRYGYNIDRGGFGGGHPTSEETKQKISKANKGRPCPEHQRRWLSKINKGIMPTNLDDIHKKNQKPIDQFDIDGNYIATYPSIRIASREIGVAEGAIGNCVRGIYRTSGGYIWKFSVQT